MYCNACGSIIPDNASFCNACGTKITPVQPQGNGRQNRNGTPMSVGATNRAQNSLQGNSMSIRELWVTQDLALNNRLFGFYRQMIPPLQQMEDNVNRIQENEATIRRLKVDNNRLRVNNVSGTLSVIACIVCLICTNLYFKYTYDLSGFGLSFLTLIIGGGVCLVATIIIISLFNKPKWNKRIEEIQKENMGLQEENRRIQDDLSRFIVIVPPAYRYAEAVWYFVESYDNARIQNLREAVNAYDQYHFQRQLLQSQQMTLAALQTIEFQLDVLWYL